MENKWQAGDRVQDIGAAWLAGTVTAVASIYAVVAWDMGTVSRVIFHQVESAGRRGQ